MGGLCAREVTQVCDFLFSGCADHFRTDKGPRDVSMPFLSVAIADDRIEQLNRKCAPTS